MISAVISAAVRIGCNHVRQTKIAGEVTEWLKVHDWKSCRGLKPPRGFESLPLRQSPVYRQPEIAIDRRTLLNRPSKNAAR